MTFWEAVGRFADKIWFAQTRWVVWLSFFVCTKAVGIWIKMYIKVS